MRGEANSVSPSKISRAPIIFIHRASARCTSCMLADLSAPTSPWRRVPEHRGASELSQSRLRGGRQHQSRRQLFAEDAAECAFVTLFFAIENGDQLRGAWLRCQLLAHGFARGGG